jgi:hypothetical protein
MKKEHVAICRSVRGKEKRREGKTRGKEENDRAYRNTKDVLVKDASNDGFSRSLYEDTVLL